VPVSKVTANRNLDEDYGSGTPATLYACLTTSAPDLAAGGGNGTIVQPTSVEYVGYAEVAITNDATHWPAAVAGVKTLGVAFNFPPAGAGSIDNTPLTHLVFRTASTGSGGGRIVDSLPLPAGTVVTSAVAQFFLAGSIVITET
jgi:hypothetical protein